MNTHKIALAQIHSYLGNIDLNLKKHYLYIEKARKEEADLVVFPELSLTGYLLKDLAYELSGKCEESIRKMLDYSQDICIIAGVIEEHRIGIYRNSMVVICDGEVKGFVPKLYLPSYGLFEESRYFQEGGANDVKVFEYKGLKFGVVICEDAWHPEPVELLAHLGADIVFISSSSPLRGLYDKNDTFIEKIWEAINITRAIENNVFIGFVNRVGVEDEEYFWGGSMVVSPEGRVIKKAPKMEEKLLIVDIDFNSLRRARRFSSFKIHRRDLHYRMGEL